MRKILTASIFCVMTAGLIAWAQTERAESSDDWVVEEEENEIIIDRDADLVAEISGYSVRISGVDSIPYGLEIFHESMLESGDGEMLSLIEKELYNMAFNPGDDAPEKLIILSGSIKDFKKIHPDTPCTVYNYDGKEFLAKWNQGGKDIIVSVPLSYEVARNGSRSDIEQDFIARLKGPRAIRTPFHQIDPQYLEVYRDSLFILPGMEYHHKDINRNVYLASDTTMQPVWSVKYPLESVADLMIYPSGAYCEVPVEVKVLKHEYGESESFTVSLGQLIAVAEREGCRPFWGVESLEDGKLNGALFLLNSDRGYNHVFKMDMEPAKVIEGNGKIVARASLYVPVNNVDNLFEPYRKKSNKEKIKY